MTTRREQLLEQVAAAQKAQERMLRELAEVGPLEELLERLPDQSVVRYRRQWGGTGPRYSYAAIKVNGKWYETGRRGDTGRGTEQMASLLASGRVSDLAVAVEWEESEASEQPDLLEMVAGLVGVTPDRLGEVLLAAAENRAEK